MEPTGGTENFKMLSIRKVSESEETWRKGRRPCLGEGPLFLGARSSLYGDSRQKRTVRELLAGWVHLLGEQGFPSNGVQPVDCIHYMVVSLPLQGPSITLA